jgi:SAM-dependent methyltransferase
MTHVSRDFERIYREERDPWGIDEADSERYALYRRLVLEYAGPRGALLDIGCGFGAFLARFRGEFESLHGVDVSERAITQGSRRFPFINYIRSSADNLTGSLSTAGRFDAVIYSDVIYYLKERGKRRSLRWIADHLAPDGLAFIAAWAPGGKYLDPSELRRLVERDFAIERSLLLDTDHAVFICRPRRVLCALTVDYETWQPLPDGKMIDWDRDILHPTACLLDIFDAEGATLTLMAEMGEYFWLVKHRAEVARQMEEQWREAVRRGHDVQLHLHPAWLPELGACRDGESWYWDPGFARAYDYPGDLAALIGRCKAALEGAIRLVDPTYEVTSFRAGAYEAQPFPRLYDALAANGIVCDSSVLPGDRRPDRHYDYRAAYSSHQPYAANRLDPQHKAAPGESAITELPVCAITPGQQWTFDDEEGPRFAQRLAVARERERYMPSTETLRRYRRARAIASVFVGRVLPRSVAPATRPRESERLKDYAHQRVRTGLYVNSGRLRHWYHVINRSLPQPIKRAVAKYEPEHLLPRSVARAIMAAEPERLVEHEYFVLVAHTKAALDFDAIATGLRRLRQQEIELRSLTELAQCARVELERVDGHARII